MRKKLGLLTIFVLPLMLAGCDLLVLDPKGPQAERQANDILLSIGIMSFIVIVVFSMLIYMLIKYRASKQKRDYEPPHIDGNKFVETIIVIIPVIIVAILSFVSVKSNYIVESTPVGYEDQEPLTIYASSSDWKWHFSYPEQNIETVNYLYIPTNWAIEFKLYSYGPITSFWIPQLAGQKYAMSDMITTLHLAAEVPGEFMGRNANFSGKGFAENVFHVKAVPSQEFDEWVDEVKQTAEPLTEKRFEELLKPGHLGQLTFNNTHLQFSPPPKHHHGTDVGEEEKEKSSHSEEH
jgi:cytochrome aa3-600 menaquinol oxidase subunit II